MPIAALLGATSRVASSGTRASARAGAAIGRSPPPALARINNRVPQGSRVDLNHPNRPPQQRQSNITRLDDYRHNGIDRINSQQDTFRRVRDSGPTTDQLRDISPQPQSERVTDHAREQHQQDIQERRIDAREERQERAQQSRERSERTAEAHDEANKRATQNNQNQMMSIIQAIAANVQGIRDYFVNKEDPGNDRLNDASANDGPAGGPGGGREPGLISKALNMVGTAGTAAVAGTLGVASMVGSKINDLIEKNETSANIKSGIFDSIFATVDKVSGGLISGNKETADIMWRNSPVGRTITGEPAPQRPQRRPTPISQEQHDLEMSVPTPTGKSPNLGPTIEPIKKDLGPTIEPIKKVSVPRSTQDRFEKSVPDLIAASEISGVDAGTLAKITNIESRFNPTAQPVSRNNAANKYAPAGVEGAKKGISSAYGYGQFLNATWEEQVMKHGSKYGVKGTGKDGTITKADANRYRADPRVQAGMLAEYSKQGIAMGNKLGAKDADANVYAHHNLGPGGAKRLFDAVGKNPNAPITSVLTAEEIRNNPSLYKSGMTVGEAYGNLGKKMREGEHYAQAIKERRPNIKSYRDGTTLESPGEMIAKSENQSPISSQGNQPKSFARTSVPISPEVASTTQSSFNKVPVDSSILGQQQNINRQPANNSQEFVVGSSDNIQSSPALASSSNVLNQISSTRDVTQTMVRDVLNMNSKEIMKQEKSASMVQVQMPSPPSPASSSNILNGGSDQGSIGPMITRNQDTVIQRLTAGILSYGLS